MTVGRKLAVPAAAALIISGALNVARPGGPAQAATARDVSGTIAFTDTAFPDGTILGGAYGNTGTDGEVQAPLVDSLLGIDNHQQFFADLATQVPTTANGGIKVVNGDEVVTYHLKPNLKWSDGSPITVADFIIGLRFDFAPEVNFTIGVDNIKTLTSSGNDLIFTYKGIYAPALFYGVPQILPFAYLEKKYKTSIPASLVSSYDAATAPAVYTGSYKGSDLQKMAVAWTSDNYNSPNDVFNGPYKIGEWTTDQRVTEVPNPYYTALPPDKAHPRPARIQFVIVTEDGNAYPLDMTAGSTYNNIDLAEDFRPISLPTLKRSKYQVVVKPALGYSHLELNQNVPALRDVRVRQALYYAINKTEYIQALFRGAVDATLASQLALQSFLPSSSPWSNNASLPVNPYNPDKARSLLAAAGYATTLNGPGNHLTLTYSTFASPQNIRSSELLQSYWARIGVQIRIAYVPGSGPNSEFAPYSEGGVTAHRRFQIIQFSFSTNIDPDQSVFNFQADQIPDATHPLGANFAGINDPHIVDLFLKARHTLDEAQRHKYYDEVQTYFVQQAYWIILYDNPNITLYKGTIGNFKPNPTQVSNEWNAFEWYRTQNASPL